jgi:small-conductance mechanosensitive channel
LLIVVSAIVLILIGLPGISNNVIQLLGLVAGAIVAFSSSTLIANLMSGVLIKMIEPYKVGNIIQIKNNFGKVYHIGLFHTEIQSPKREIINIPNLVAISDIITNFSESGYIVNVTVSLGYDISISEVEATLINAVKCSGLVNPFVLVNDLGNYGIEYEVNGLLEDATKIITARSNLRRNILIECTKNDIEIMTPLYVGKREISRSGKVMAALTEKDKKRHSISSPEKVMYEKADVVVSQKESKEAEENISAGMKTITEK